MPPIDRSVGLGGDSGRPLWIDLCGDDGCRYALPYRDLRSIEMPSAQNIMLEFSDRRVVVHGRNLEPVYEALVKEQVAQLIIEIAGDVMNESGVNLVKLLAENRRLNVVAEIVEQYETLKADAEKTVEAEIVSAHEVSDAQQTMIAEKLKARLGREVSLKCRVDESLMGGAIIKAGDMVIDGSVSGQLNKLSVELAG